MHLIFFIKIHPLFYAVQEQATKLLKNRSVKNTKSFSIICQNNLLKKREIMYIHSRFTIRCSRVCVLIYQDVVTKYKTRASQRGSDNLRNEWQYLLRRVFVNGVILLNKTRAVWTGCHRFAIKREQRTHCWRVEYSRTAVMRARLKIISRNCVARELLDASDSSTKSVFGGRQSECKRRGGGRGEIDADVSVQHINKIGFMAA